MKRITIQGQPGCFHETAARCSFPGEQVEILPCDSFDQQFARMAADPTLLGIAAIENTIAGSLLPNHELLRRSSLAVIGEYNLASRTYWRHCRGRRPATSARYTRTRSP